MFENLRQAFREALDNFREELNRDQVPESVDRLLAGMRNEVAEAKVALRALEDQLARTEAEIEHEARERATCLRREEMANAIGDAETAEVARRFAAKHEERHRIVTHKAAALREERTFRKREIEEMLAQVKQAQSKRDAVAATTGRTQARESIHAADDLFAELDRMAEKIDDADARADAARDFPNEFDLHVDPHAPRRPEPDMDRRLDELKRRMGRE